MRGVLFIDRLSMTIAVPLSERDEVKNRLSRLAERGEILQEDGEHSELLKSFRFAFHISFNLQCSCTIQIDPYKQGHRFMRLEWNPALSNAVYTRPMNAIAAILAACIPSYSADTILNANITRIDLAFDLRRVSVDSLLVYYDILRRPVSGRYFATHPSYTRLGRLNSMEIGKADADRYLLIYDKNLEQKTRQIGLFSVTPTRRSMRPILPRIPASRTRFELRCRRIGPMANLFEMENPFAAYTVVSYINAGGVRHDHIWQWFIESCKAIGAQAALSMIDDRREQAKYRAALREGQPPAWWKPNEIWGELRNALHKALNI